VNSAVVLASGGLDSIVNLYQAAKVSRVKLALTFDYGQRAAKKEAESAAFHCQKLNIPHRVLDVTWFREFTTSALVNRSRAVPSEMSLDDAEVLKLTAEAVWVPNRNGIMLNIAAGYAEGLGAEFVVPGFNVEEALTFPDNSQGFVDSMNAALKFSTNNKVRVHCFTTGLNKPQIVGLAVELGVDMEKLWPCYNDGAEICGECESCLRFKRAQNIWKTSVK
jgi:7-cyano-7-deazaguanine synthase